MSVLKLILEKFNHNPGVAGSVVCTRDGILIESRLSERFSDETISALVSSVGLTLNNVCRNLDYECFSRYQIFASKGNLIIVDIGKSFFVALLEKHADPAQVNVAIYQAANELKKQANLG